MGDCIGTHPWDEVCPRCDTGDSKDFQASTKHDPTPTPEQPTASAKPYPRWWPHDAADALRSYRSRNTVNGKTFDEILDAALDNAYEAGRAAVSAPEQDEAVRDTVLDLADHVRGGIDAEPYLNLRDNKAAHVALDDLVRRALATPPPVPAAPPRTPHDDMMDRAIAESRGGDVGEEPPSADDLLRDLGLDPDDQERWEVANSYLTGAVPAAPGLDDQLPRFRRAALFTAAEAEALNAALDRTYHYCSCGEAETDAPDCDNDGWTVASRKALDSGYAKIQDATIREVRP